MSSVPILANGFRLNPTPLDLEIRNLHATKTNLDSMGLKTFVRRLDDGRLEVVVIKCYDTFCVGDKYICDDELCHLVEEKVKIRIGTLYALKDLDETQVVFRKDFSNK